MKFKVGDKVTLNRYKYSGVYVVTDVKDKVIGNPQGNSIVETVYKLSQGEEYWEENCLELVEGETMTKDERAVYTFALRYALPRHSYALSIVSREILSRIDAFEDWELDGMIRDCWIYYPSLDCGGDIDRQKADDLKDKLIAELENRGRGDLLSRLKDEAERRGGYK